MNLVHIRSGLWLFVIIPVFILGGLPGLTFAQCEKARSLRFEGNYREAEKAARQCLESDPENVPVWTELSRILAARGKNEAALEWINKGLEKYPNDTALRLWRIQLWMRNDELKKARRELSDFPESAFETFPKADLIKGRLHFWEEEYRSAIPHLTRYLKNEGEDAMALYQRGICNQKLGNRLAAKQDFERSCNLAPKRTSACRILRSAGRGTQITNVSFL